MTRFFIINVVQMIVVEICHSLNEAKNALERWRRLGDDAFIIARSLK